MSEEVIAVIASSFVGLFISSSFFLFRKYWIFAVQRNHSKIVSLYIRSHINNDTVPVEPNEFPTWVDRQYDCIWKQDKMLTHFWVWNIGKMIQYPEEFSAIYHGLEKNETLN